jgi:DNA-binding XRE family transcriptional regulator
LGLSAIARVNAVTARRGVRIIVHHPQIARVGVDVAVVVPRVELPRVDLHGGLEILRGTQLPIGAVEPFLHLDHVVSYRIPGLMPVLLRRWRERRDYSVRELARRAGVGYVTVVRIENGHVSPTVAMLDKLAKALRITVRDLFPVERRPHRTRRRV